jgi:hypothetical protein
MHLGVISCCAAKRSYACRAKDMYLSQLFIKKVEYLHNSSVPWVILSAHLSLVLPEQQIEPYDVALQQMSKQELIEWRAYTSLQFAMHVAQHDVTKIINLTSSTYWEGMDVHLPKNIEIEHPLRGKGIGAQIGFLTKENAKNMRYGFYESI